MVRKKNGSNFSRDNLESGGCLDTPKGMDYNMGGKQPKNLIESGVLELAG